MVPHAETEMVRMLPLTFGYLEGSGIGIELNIFDNPYASDLAAVQLSSAHIEGTPAIVKLGFPNWFIEGTAQAVCGDTDSVRRRLDISAGTDEDSIRAALQGNNSLGMDDLGANYATGYLAGLYLGYLVGGMSMEEADVTAGLDRLMNKIRGGSSLDRAIAEHTDYEGFGKAQLLAADFDADGEITAADVLSLCRAIVGLEG